MATIRDDYLLRPYRSTACLRGADNFTTTTPRRRSTSRSSRLPAMSTGSASPSLQKGSCSTSPQASKMRNTAAAELAGEWVDPTRRSLRQLDRQLQRSERSLYNCVNSILADAAFVQEIIGLYPSLPTLANLRCGLW